MFMDAADSTGLAERADPEALRRVMTNYFDEIRVTVERHGGTVEKYIGDAVMAVFGVPLAHEDDALRAVRAATEVVQRLAELSNQLERERGLSISWRTGINTGEVMAGDTASGQRFVSGDAVNVAARLQQAAQPGEVLLGAETERLVRQAIDSQPVPPVAAKGKAQPVPAFRLVGRVQTISRSASRLESPMVGRARQRRLLDGAFEEAIDERICHLFTILGAAGVGKSRLVEEFVAGLGDSAVVLRGRCLSYGEGITFWPIAEAVRQAAKVNESDDEAALRAKIGALVDEERDRSTVIELIGALLGRFGAPGVPEETAWAVRIVLESLGRRSPVVLILDDIHWAEHALLDLAEHLADWTRDAPLLLICLARQELLDLRPGWGGGKKHATTLTLEPLSDGESRELLVNLLGDLQLGSDLGSKISTAAEGNPLYVEEMVGMLIDNGDLIRADTGWAASGNLSAISVPPTIQALLAARLDGLTRPERSVIERGAVEGKIFHRSAVAELAPDDIRGSVPDQLRSLSRKELVQPDRSDFAGDAAFRFRHLLIRDAAYSAMPKEARADLHARFARWLTRMSADHIAEYEEILGYHLEQAYRYRAELGPIDAQTVAVGAEAATHLGNAGLRAQNRGDARAAIKLLRSAIDLAGPELAGRSRMVAELGLAMVVAGNLREADALLRGELERATSAGDELGALDIEVSLLTSQTMFGQLTITQIIAQAERLLALARAQDDQWAIEHASYELARHHFFAGRAHVAEDMLEALLQRYESRSTPASVSSMLLAAMFWGPRPVSEAYERAEKLRLVAAGRSTESAQLRVAGGMRGLLGEFDVAREMIQRSIDVELDLGRLFTANSAKGMFLGPLELDAGRYDDAERVMIEAYDEMSKTGDRAFSATVAGHLAELYLATGRTSDAERQATIALTDSSTDDVEAQAQGAAIIARVHAIRGQHEAALESIARALEIAQQTDYLHRLGSVNQHLAEVHLAAGRRSEAVAAVGRAVEYFDAKGALFAVQRARRRLAEIEGS